MLSPGIQPNNLVKEGRTRGGGISVTPIDGATEELSASGSTESFNGRRRFA